MFERISETFLTLDPAKRLLLSFGLLLDFALGFAIGTILARLENQGRR